MCEYNRRMRFVVGVGFVLAGSVAAAGPLDKPAFTATSAELLAEAKAVPAGDAEVVVLRDDLTASLDARGRATKHFHTVFAIAKPSGIDPWGTSAFDWSPFYQDKPKIRAGVIAPGGTVAELDPALITDAPAISTSPSVFSDRRKLEAPLPGLLVGAVVEQDIEEVDRQPLLEAGVVESFTV